MRERRSGAVRPLPVRCTVGFSVASRRTGPRVQERTASAATRCYRPGRRLLHDLIPGVLMIRCRSGSDLRGRSGRDRCCRLPSVERHEAVATLARPALAASATQVTTACWWSGAVIRAARRGGAERRGPAPPTNRDARANCLALERSAVERAHGAGSLTAVAAPIS